MIARVPRPRTITPVLPREIAVHDGLAYSLWLPDEGREVRGGVVILHGAGSCKESHHDFARAAVALGLAQPGAQQLGHRDDVLQRPAVNDALARAVAPLVE